MVVLAAGAALPLLVLAGCGGGDTPDDEGVYVIDYRLWEADQETAYRTCAESFTAANPGLIVKVTQRSLDDYWSTLSTGFETNTAPDVFMNDLSKYPDLVRRKLILPLDDLVPGIDTTQYVDGLADLWVAADGKRYGLPKDWNTTALFYNKAMTDEAGITADEMHTLTWNPQDGGTYENVIAKLTVDRNGTRGDEAGFDKDHVAVYGLGLAGSGAGLGQIEWSYFTNTTGWTHADPASLPARYTYDDPRFQEAIAWWKGLIDKGYMPPLATTMRSTMADSFGAGRAAINANGSRMINAYSAYGGFTFGIAPTPVGPNGKRASMISSRADSISAVTGNKEAAARWVAFLGSAGCQHIVGQAGVVLPAIPSAIDEARTAFEAKGVDISTFTAQLDDEATFVFPITDHAAEISAIMAPAMDAVLSGQAPVSSLTAANEHVNALPE